MTVTHTPRVGFSQSRGATCNRISQSM
jgi:hypothetical protein